MNKIKLSKEVNWDKLDISREELSKWREYTVEVLRYTKTKGDIQHRAGTIIRQAVDGWDRSGSDFETRVKAKIGFVKIKAYEDKQNYVDPLEGKRDYTKAGRKPKELKEDYYALSGIETNVGIPPGDLFTRELLSSEEIIFAKDREESYRNEFNFNLSSDSFLLNQLIVDELIIRRTQLARMKGDTISQSSINKVMEGFVKNLKALGVTREQRMENDQDIQGNIGQLSVELESKLEQIKKLVDKDRKEKVLKRILDKIQGTTYEELIQYSKEMEYQMLHDQSFPIEDVESL